MLIPFSKGLHNSKIFTKAIQNSNSLLWNLKMGARGRGSFGPFSDQENVDHSNKPNSN